MSLNFDSKKYLECLFGNSVIFDESMSRHTSLRVGGPAEAYVVPDSTDKMLELIAWSRQKGIPYLVMGDGTNLLVKDGGIPGIVIALSQCLKEITKTPVEQDIVMVTAMAGARMQSLCSFAIEFGLEGMNFALGIPGSVGGGIMMNAGTGLGSVEGVLDSVKVLQPEGRIERIRKEHLNFSYRQLTWMDEKGEIYKEQPVILDGFFCLHPSDSGKLKEEAEAILKTRKKNQPTQYPSAGCFFKNPPSGKTAGELIDMAGLKEKKIGGAKISPKHANFIINTGKATASDILELMDVIHETVSIMFNINLEPEVKIVGR